MYANHHPWDSSLSSDSGLPANNPFLENNAANRFPAIDPPQQSSSLYLSQSISPAPSQFQQQLYTASQQQVGWSNQLQQPQLLTYGPGVLSGYGTPQAMASAYASPSQQFDQGSHYGASPQLQAQYSGYPQLQQTPGSPVTSQQYLQYQQSIISQFDPYNGQGGSQQNQNTAQGAPAPGIQLPNLRSTSPSGKLHPRQYIQSNKAKLESWDAATWKQALMIFEELKYSWETRRAEIQRQLIGGHYLTAEEIAHLNMLTRNAESNIDSVVASLIQMQEVHSGYKHSLDATSKRRVREALNAGLQGLPEWP